MNLCKITVKGLVLMLLVGAIFIFTGCSQANSGESENNQTSDQNIIIQDMENRLVSLDGPATKIIALSPGDCEILSALGCGDRLVGRGQYCDYPEEILDVPSVQLGNEINIEQILSLEPQILITNKLLQTEDQVKQLEAAGIKVIYSYAQNIGGVYQAIEMIGTAVAKPEEAAAVIDNMKEIFNQISQIPDGDSKTIYFEVSPLEYGLWAAGSNSFMDEIAKMMGLENCFGELSDWAEISEEQVLERNPDYIVTISMYSGSDLSPVDEILSRKGWQTITAVKTGHVFTFQNNEISRPSPRLAEAAKTLYDQINPS